MAVRREFVWGLELELSVGPFSLNPHPVTCLIFRLKQVVFTGRERFDAFEGEMQSWFSAGQVEEGRVRMISKVLESPEFARYSSMN